MGTEDRRTGTDRQAVFADLACTLQAVRGGAHAREMAAAVFRHATGSTDLVGLADDCERAVFFDAIAHTLTAVPLDEHGLGHGDGEQLGNWPRDPTTWIDARGDDLDWVHPRYRRAVDAAVPVRPDDRRP